MDNQNIIDNFLKDWKIDSVQNFIYALNICGCYFNCWALTGISGNYIRRFLSKNSRRKAYKSFKIPKKSGGFRSISSPVNDLKDIQRAINALLLSIFEPSPYAMGFCRNRGVDTNAKIHIGQTCIFNTDLENFFPSITKQMVRKALHRELGDVISSNEAINYICSLCTVPNDEGIEVLPQGSPASPVLSNIVLKAMDRKLAHYAELWGCRYTRYADDITFSHNSTVRKFSQFKQLRIRSIIEEFGLKINEKKTKVLVQGERLEVTGVTVSSNKANVARKYIKQLRTLMHLWDKYGYEQAQHIYVRDFCGGIEKSLTSVINGKINYLCMIKGKQDSTYRRFKSRYETAEKKRKALSKTKVVLYRRSRNWNKKSSPAHL